MENIVLIEDKQNFRSKVIKKLSDYRKYDKQLKIKFILENKGLETINLKDAIELVYNLKTDLCSFCECKILFCNYMPWCQYQFSYDRLDNKKIHSINNLRIICWNCNSNGYGSIKRPCSKDCHERIL